jgi:hypothetical protein
VRLEGLGELKKCKGLIGTRTPDLPTCSIAPQPTKLLRVGYKNRLHDISCRAVTIHIQCNVLIEISAVVIRFIDNFRNVITNNYISSTELHTSNITETATYIKSCLQ